MDDEEEEEGNGTIDFPEFLALLSKVYFPFLFLCPEMNIYSKDMGCLAY